MDLKQIISFICILLFIYYILRFALSLKYYTKADITNYVTIWFPFDLVLNELNKLWELTSEYIWYTRVL